MAPPGPVSAITAVCLATFGGVGLYYNIEPQEVALDYARETKQVTMEDPQLTKAEGLMDFAMIKQWMSEMSTWSSQSIACAAVIVDAILILLVYRCSLCCRRKAEAIGTLEAGNDAKSAGVTRVGGLAAPRQPTNPPAAALHIGAEIFEANIGVTQVGGLAAPRQPIETTEGSVHAENEILEASPPRPSKVDSFSQDGIAQTVQELPSPARNGSSDAN